MARHVQIVLSNPVEARREAEFNEWYTNTHIPDLMTLPGFVRAQRYRLAHSFRDPNGGPTWAYMVYYELETPDLGQMLTDLVDAHGDGRITVSDVLDNETLTALVFSPVAPFFGQAGRRRQIFVALSNPSDGREAEFNDWYDRQHVPDVVSIPGFKGAERFKLAVPFLDPLGGGHRYLTVYDVDSDDINALAAQVKEHARTGKTVMSDAIDMKSLTALFFEPVGEAIGPLEDSSSRA